MLLSSSVQHPNRVRPSASSPAQADSCLLTSQCVCCYPTPPSTDSPPTILTCPCQPPQPPVDMGPRGAAPRIRTNLGQNKVLYRFFSPMVPRALMRAGERKTVEKAEKLSLAVLPLLSRWLGGTNEAVHLGQVRLRPSNGTAYLAGEVPAPPIGGQVSARLGAGGFYPI